MDKLVLHEDRYFDSDPTLRKIARTLYEGVKELPIVAPHGHVDPGLLAENEPFPEPTSLILIPDHYIFRMLYSQGIPLEALGVPSVDGTPVETDKRKIWQIFGDHFYLFSGTPTGAWLAHELYDVFGIRTKLDHESAMLIYDEINEKLRSPEYLPRALFERFKIEVLSTTDAATDDLASHRKIRNSGWNGRVIPTFRPDAVLSIHSPDWRQHIEVLQEASGIRIEQYADFIEAIEERRQFFRSNGAVATDHAVVVPYTHRLSDSDAEEVFRKAMTGEAQAQDEALFQAHMLMEMARMSTEDGLVMQIHPGSCRNHNRFVYERFGPDKGADIPLQTEFTRNLYELLNTYGNDAAFTLVLFTLDETTYSRELAPLAGHYPALRLGPPWWFHDSIEGMTRFRQQTTETAGIYNTAGFNDDTRAFPSIPARHDLSRRIDAVMLARMVARHIIDLSDAERMARTLAYELARKTYRLDGNPAY